MDEASSDSHSPILKLPAWCFETGEREARGRWRSSNVSLQHEHCCVGDQKPIHLSPEWACLFRGSVTATLRKHCLRLSHKAWSSLRESRHGQTWLLGTYPPTSERWSVDRSAGSGSSWLLAWCWRGSCQQLPQSLTDCERTEGLQIQHRFSLWWTIRRGYFVVRWIVSADQSVIVR